MAGGPAAASGAGGSSGGFQPQLVQPQHALLSRAQLWEGWLEAQHDQGMRGDSLALLCSKSAQPWEPQQGLMVVPKALLALLHGWPAWAEGAPGVLQGLRAEVAQTLLAQVGPGSGQV